MKRFLIISLLLIAACSSGHCGSYAEIVDLDTNRVIATYDDIDFYRITGDPIIILSKDSWTGPRRQVSIATGNKVLTVRIIKGVAPR